MSERKTNQKRTDYIAAIVATHGGTQENYTRKELRAVSDSHGWKWIPNWITHDVSRRADRGVFTIPEVQEAMAVQPGHGIEGDELADTNTTTVMEQEDVMVTA